jgi:hypothetical protein
MARKRSMFAGQVDSINPANAAGQRLLSASFADGDESETAFALVYEAVLGLSDDQGSESGASTDLLDTVAQGGLPESYNSGGLHAGNSAGLGASACLFGSQDSNADIASGAAIDCTSMGRFMSKRSGSQVDPVQKQGAGIESAAYTRSQQLGDFARRSGPVSDVTASSNSSGGLNKSQLSDWMDAHALSRSSHHCAMYCRMGMEAAGLNTGDRPQSGEAGDYGPFLLRHGAQTVPVDSYIPQVGDVVVFDKTAQHPSGHIEMFDGHQWVSDFMQRSFSPYRDAMSTPSFTIYRLS